MCDREKSGEKETEREYTPPIADVVSRRSGRSRSGSQATAYASIRQHTPAYASIRQHMPAYIGGSCLVSRRSASIRQHMPAYASIHRRLRSCIEEIRSFTAWIHSRVCRVRCCACSSVSGGLVPRFFKAFHEGAINSIEPTPICVCESLVNHDIRFSSISSGSPGLAVVTIRLFKWIIGILAVMLAYADVC